MQKQKPSASKELVMSVVLGLRRSEGGREEEPTNNVAEAAPATGMRTEHTCCCLGVLVGISLIAGQYQILYHLVQHSEVCSSLRPSTKRLATDHGK